MKENEIIIKTQAIASVFSEYLIHFEPVYLKTITRQASTLNRTKRREFEKNAIEDFKKLKRIANRFSRLFENKLPEYYDQSVDALCEVLDNIKIIENEKEQTKPEPQNQQCA
jgi:hypothetical protein